MILTRFFVINMSENSRILWRNMKILGTQVVIVLIERNKYKSVAIMLRVKLMARKISEITSSRLDR